MVGFSLRTECQAREELGVFALKQLVEDVEVSLSSCLSDNTRLLQEVVVDVSTHWRTLEREGQSPHPSEYPP